MLSRLAVRTGSLASRSLTRASAPALVRTFKSTSSLFNAVPATAAPADAAASVQSPPEIINKYGAASFWGMVAAVLVSKEMFIIDAEFLLSLEITAFAMTGYVLTGDTISKMYEERDQKEKKQFDGGNDYMIEMINQYKLNQSAVQFKPDVLRQYRQEYKEAIEAHARHLTLKPQHEARAELLASFEKIRAQEQHASATEWQLVVDEAVANVREAFEDDEALDQEMIELAIKNMGFENPVTAEASDPVKRLFLKEFATDADE